MQTVALQEQVRPKIVTSAMNLQPGNWSEKITRPEAWNKTALTAISSGSQLQQHVNFQFYHVLYTTDSLLSTASPMKPGFVLVKSELLHAVCTEWESGTNVCKQMYAGELRERAHRIVALLRSYHWH